jgi:hypothetical protein
MCPTVGNCHMHVFLPGVSTDLWEQQVNTEWGILVVEVLLELMDLIAEHLWGVTDTTDNTESTSIGDSSSELWSSSNL